MLAARHRFPPEKGGLESVNRDTETGVQVEFLPFSKLTDIAIAPRVRNLLEGCYEILWREFAAGLARAQDDFERELFKLAERAASSDLQNRLFAAIKECKRKRGDVELGARRALQRGMLSLLDPRLRDESTAAEAPAGKLSLIDNAELEETLAISEVAAKAEVRFSQTLFAVGIRFSVIGGGAPLVAEQLPIGPWLLMRAVAAGARELDMETRQRVMLFNQFDRSAMSRYGELLDAINRYLVESRVLPHLNLSLGRARAGAGAGGSAAAAPLAVDGPAPAAAESAAAAGAGSGQRSAPAEAEARHMPPVEAPAAAAVAEADAVPELTPATRFGPLSAFEPVPSGPVNAAQDAEFFSTLRELLSGRRMGSDEPGVASSGHQDGAVPAASTADLQSVLTVLQSQPTTPIMVGGRWVGRQISHIKQDALNQLRSMSGGQTPRLRPEDADTMDLVGMLFDHLLKDAKATSTTHGLLTKLQVPLLKVALQDKSFFTRRNHPARQLLNAIAETSLFWVEDEDADRAVIEKMQMVVDRVCSEYDDDVKVFEHLLGDLGRHAQTIQRKAEVTEKRHVDAARGRERLELARVRATEAIEQRTRGKQLPEIAQRVLGDAWADVLALTLLRQGEDSAAYRAQLDVADELIDCFDGRFRAYAIEHFETLRLALSEGLGLVGFHGDEVEQTLNGLMEALPSPVFTDLPASEAAIPPPESPSVRAVTELVKEKTKATKEEKATILESLRKTERIPITPKEHAMIERIKQLPFGTWFEFQVNQQGSAVRRKLSWFSTVTGRCLFVNARGAKSEEKTLEQLARDLLRGNAAVVEEHTESMIDKTWKAIVGRLKSWTGIGQSPNVASADA